jgi:diguanylate cyclase (GGDEF)-like protein
LRHVPVPNLVHGENLRFRVLFGIYISQRITTPMLADLGYALAQAAVFYSIMLAMFRYRRWIGIGTFFCALCALTFAENYLAITVFVGLGPVIYTPGSVILFTGKLLLLLLVYIREDAHVVRQPIYGLLIGNFVIIAVVLLVSYQTRIGTSAAGFAIDMVAESTWLSVWGTVLLFIDCVALILLYERFCRVRWLNLFGRLWLSAVIVLAFDQLAFFSALYAFFGVPFSAGAGGFAGKVVASGVYSFVLWAYLRYLEGHLDASDHQHRLSDVFGTLTYRQRFEEMRETARMDALTGAENRRALFESGSALIRQLIDRGDPVSLFMIDIDGFKKINDAHGHSVGDRVLNDFVSLMRSTMRDTDRIYRYGGDEFVVIAPGADHLPGRRLAEAIRDATVTLQIVDGGDTISISVGHATGPAEGTTLGELVDAADRSMYATRHGRPSDRGS